MLFTGNNCPFLKSRRRQKYALPSRYDEEPTYEHLVECPMNKIGVKK